MLFSNLLVRHKPPVGSPATGDPSADRIREAVEASPNGLSRNHISRLFYGHVNSERIDAALEQLAAYREQTSGRISTLWLAVQQ
jgi:hypothetical protein